MRPTRNIPPRNLNATECACFEWFTFKTVKKLRGVFRSEFWDQLVFQACFDEPAVRHAVLALSSVQRRDISADEPSKGTELSPDGHEEFVLRQYGKAIQHLLPRPGSTAQPNVNVVLLSCLVFIFLEFLRGHYKAAHGHLRNGLRLIAEVHSPRNTAIPGTSLSKVPVQRIEQGILDSFARIQVQVALFSPLNHTVDSAPQTTKPNPSGNSFASVEQAREQLDYLINGILRLEEKFRHDDIEESDNKALTTLLRNQQQLRDALNSWKDAYTLSTVAIETSMPFREVFGYRLLHVYHTMATIMVNAAVYSDPEAIFDKHVNEFRSIIIQAEELRRIVKSVAVIQDLAAHYTDKSQSIADIGWIPPLYYTALKCGDHTLRQQAVGFLRLMPHREGIWDSNMAASIAENVIAIEEGSERANTILADDLEIDGALRTWLIAESHRIQEVRIKLPDHPSSSIEFAYRNKGITWTWGVARQGSSNKGKQLSL